MEPINWEDGPSQTMSWILVVVALITGLVLGAAGGYYIGFLQGQTEAIELQYQIQAQQERDSTSN